MSATTKETLQYIKDLEALNLIDPDCLICNRHLYPGLLAGAKLGEIFCSSHTASRNCESGKHPHCTCDTCF